MMSPGERLRRPPQRSQDAVSDTRRSVIDLAHERGVATGIDLDNFYSLGDRHTGNTG